MAMKKKEIINNTRHYGVLNLPASKIANKKRHTATMEE